MELLLIIAISAGTILAWRLWVARRVVKLLIQSVRSSEPVILPDKGIFGRHADLDELARAFNDLLAEKENITGAGEAYHGQIQALLGNLREAVVMVDQHNLIHSVNPAMLELTGSREDPVGKRLDSLIQGTQFLQFVRNIRLKEPGHASELEVRIGSGSRWLEVSAAPLNDNSQKGSRYTLFIFHDITRQKKLEKMRTEFVANVSHELRTPVTIIKGFTETLIEDDAILTAKEKKRFLKKISKNSDRLHRLLEDLMLLTRLESTDMVLQLELFSLNDFLEEFVDNLRSSKKYKRGPALHLELGADVEINADPLRLSQVLTNLLENAYLHAKDATEIRLATEQAGAAVKFSVSDNGAGIPEADLPHIFQRFFRVEKGRSRESGGTGLGLSIVKHIVAQHGGQITAQSEPGKGTRIDFTIPLDVTTASPAHK